MNETLDDFINDRERVRSEDEECCDKPVVIPQD